MILHRFHHLLMIDLSIVKIHFQTGKDHRASTTPDNFDPWDAYYKPESESYKFRVSQEKKLVHETVDNELAKLQGQMAMNNLKTELVSKHNLGADDAEKFLQFATTPKANLPIETLIKVWKENEGTKRAISFLLLFVHLFSRREFYIQGLY